MGMMKISGSFLPWDGYASERRWFISVALLLVPDLGLALPECKWSREIKRQQKRIEQEQALVEVLRESVQKN